MSDDIVSPTKIITKYCFVCGGKLKDIDGFWSQCSNKDCWELFYVKVDSDKRTHLILQPTPSIKK